MTTTEYLDLLDRLARIERLIIQATPPSRRSGYVMTASLAKVEPTARQAALLKMFEMTACLPRGDKHNQHFPKPIIQPPGSKENWRICPQSVLVNRSSMRAAFRCAEPGDDSSARANVEKALAALVAQGVLGVATVSGLTGLGGSQTLVVFDPVGLPAAFAERVGVVVSREVGKEQEDDVEATEEPRSKLVWPEERAKLEKLAEKALEEEDEEDEDEVPVPPKKLDLPEWMDAADLQTEDDDDEIVPCHDDDKPCVVELDGDEEVPAAARVVTKFAPNKADTARVSWEDRINK